MAKVALITGASQGLGRELALALAKEGWAVAVVDVAEAGLLSLAETIRASGGTCAWKLADVSNANDLMAKVESLEGELGPVELAIANAGIGRLTTALDLDPTHMAATIQVNLLGVSNTLSAVLPGMIRRRAGHVVAISSVAAWQGLPRMLGYCASKAGVNAFMEGVRLELGPLGILATTICPGWIRTPMTQRLGVPLPDLMDADEAARVILWAIARRKRFYAFPRRMVWRMKFLTWLPERIQRRILKKMMRPRFA